MTTAHVIASSMNHPSPHHSGSGSNVVGVHYRVGKKIGEGSFGVIFEGPFITFGRVVPTVRLMRASHRDEFTQLSGCGHQIREWIGPSALKTAHFNSHQL